MITSHETVEDFDIFYQGMITLCKQFDIEFDPGFIMQDACPASATSIKKLFPEVEI